MKLMLTYNTVYTEMTFKKLKIAYKPFVPDKRSRILEVVLVRRLVTWVLGFGGGREWERVEKGEVNLQAT